MFIFNAQRSGFTLIELMVVIAIIGILFVGSYVPYDYYNRISRVRISVEKFHQALEEARLLSENGQIFPGTTKNANTSLLLKKGSHTIDMFASLSGSHAFSVDENTKLIKTITLEDGVNITSLPRDVILIEYTAPRGEQIIYTSNTEIGTAFELGLGWKMMTSGAQFKTINIGK